jgi:hypothetical protein
LTLPFRWSKAKFKSPCNFEESTYVARVIYENVAIVFIEIYRIRSITNNIGAIVKGTQPGIPMWMDKHLKRSRAFQ